MPKFFVKKDQIQNDEVNIINGDVNHIKNVLRYKIGDELDICNNENGENFRVVIQELNNSKIKCKIIKKIDNNTESNVFIHIYQGLPKAEKMELIIQKATELGAAKITPIEMERSIVKIKENDKIKKTTRWQKIAEVAAKQSGRNNILEIDNIKNIKEIAKEIEKYDTFIVTYEKEMYNKLKSELEKITKINNPKIGILIGPEGGITEEEISILKEGGAKIVTLGKRILRTETVALMVCSIIQYVLEK